MLYVCECSFIHLKLTTGLWGERLSLSLFNIPFTGEEAEGPYDFLRSHSQLLESLGFQTTRVSRQSRDLHSVHERRLWEVG